jgi:hypothetical protein
MSPHAWQGKFWVSYDDEKSVDLKARYALHYGLKGAFVWEIDTDNFMGLWGKEKYTITQAINRALIAGKGLEEHEILGSANMNMACEPKAQLCNPSDYTIPSLATATARPTSAMTSPTTTPRTTTTTTPRTTTSGSGDCSIEGCDEDGDLLPYPGNCHLYYRCNIPGDNGEDCTLETFDCGDFFFDPNTSSCGHEPLPGDDLLCRRPVDP